MSKRYALTRRDIAVVFAALTFLAAVNLSQLVVQSEGSPPAVADRPMPGRMQVAYDQWDETANSISVFARGDTAYGWATGYLGEAAAIEDAMRWCARDGPDCGVIEIRADLQAANGVDLPVTDKMAAVLPRFFAMSGPAAFAVSDTGAYAIGRGRTANGADVNARAQCAQQVARGRPRHLLRYPCRIIARR